MQLTAPLEGEAPVGDISQHAVPETQPAGTVGVEEPLELAASGSVESDLLLGQQLIEHLYPEAPAEHTGIAEQPPGERWKGVDLRAHNSIERIGQVLHSSRLTDGSHDLAQEEGQTAGPLHDRVEIVRTEWGGLSCRNHQLTGLIVG